MSKLTVLCHVFSFLKSTAPRPEVSSLVNQKGNANSCSSHPSSCVLFEVKSCSSKRLWENEVRRRQQFVWKKSWWFVCPCARFPQGIYSWLFILFLLPSHMARESNGLKSWVLFLIKLSSIHSLVTVMKWLASIGEKVSISWAMTLCMIKDTGKCSSSRWSPHSFISWKLSSISRIKAARGREGICFHHPQVEHILPAPEIQHIPINSRVQWWNPSLIHVDHLNLTSCYSKETRAAKLTSSNTAEGEICTVRHQRETCCFKKE